MYYWIYSHVINGIPVVDRSIPITCEWRAIQRVKELKEQYGHAEAFYTSGFLKHFWY